MTQASHPDQGLNGLSLAKRVDAVCTRFEDAWKAGQRPRIEDFLSAAADPERAELLRELLPLELEYRHRGGENACLHEYSNRFPEHLALVEEIIAALRPPEATQPPPPPSNTATFGHLPLTADGTPPVEAAFAPPMSGESVPRVPGYEVLGLLGKGGMGVVYKARHLALNRVVALKMLRDGELAGDEERRRFEVEALAVAQLQHPHIVPIHEVGRHNGLPFLSLEFCAGGSLSAKLDGTPLPPREAASLVETLARTMQAAHAQRIIHRDLKPANVLLDAEGRPKITDFGLARKLDEVGQTATGAILGTPSYMAPEQAGGSAADVGPLADVYALGAVLYELLTGRPPFKAATAIDTLFLVRTVEPVAPRHLQPKVPRDLETICLKCLHKVPARRYASAVDLAEDLMRFLRDEPIRARPVGRAERLWRWCRRQPLAAALVAALVLVVAGGFTGMTYLWLLAEGSLGRANRESRRVRQVVNEFFTQVSQRPELKNHDLEDLRRQWLQRAREYYDEFVRDDPGPALSAERGVTYRELAVITADIGSRPEAIALAEQAREIFDDLVMAHTEVTEYRAELAATLNTMGLLYQASGRLNDAEKAHRSAFDLQDQLVRDHQDNARFRKQLGLYVNNLGVLYRATDRPRQSRDAYEQARDIFIALDREHPDDPSYQIALAGAYSNVAKAYTDLREERLADTAHQEAVLIADKVVSAYPKVPDYRARQANFLNNFGVFHLDTGRPKLAKEALERGLAIRKSLALEHPGVFEYQAAVVQSTHNVALALNTIGSREEARKGYQTALDLCVGLAKQHDSIPAYRSLLASSYNNLGNLHSDAGHWDLAESAYGEALRIRKKLVDDDRSRQDYAVDLASFYFNLGHHHKDRQPQLALESYAAALEILGPLADGTDFPAKSQKVQVKCWYNRAILLENQGHPKEALAAYRKAITLREALVARHPDDLEFVLDLGKAQSHLGQVLAGAGDRPAALTNLDLAVSRLESVRSKPRVGILASTYLMETLESRADALDRSGRSAEALRDLDRALAIEDNWVWKAKLVLAQQLVLDHLREQALRQGRAGDCQQAATAAEVLAKHKPTLATNLYRSARIYALCAAAPGKGPTATSEERNTRADGYAVKAVNLLEQLAADGYFSKRDTVKKLEQDPDFAALRSRKDFQGLLDKLARSGTGEP